MILGRATESHPSLPSSAAYGWELLAMCQPPAPEAVINLENVDAKKAVQYAVVVVRRIHHVQRCVVAWVTVATTDITL